MALVSMKEMLADARKRKYAVGAFDVSNYEMIRSVVEVAKELQSPVILSALKPDIIGRGIDYFIAMAKTAADSVNVPVCIHLDHAVEMEIIKNAIYKGFTSVMFDGSILPFHENAKITREVCQFAHQYGVTVEAELGHVTDVVIGKGEGKLLLDERKTNNPYDFLTDPKEVDEFIQKTDVDALAVAIGTAHGLYISKPILDFNRLKEINEISTVPLVLHGGSGIPDEDIKKVVELGICKINIFSEVLNEFFSSLRDRLNTIEDMSTWPYIMFKQPIESMKRVIRKKILLFGSSGKA